MRILGYLLTWFVFFLSYVAGCTIPTALIGTWTSSNSGTIELNSTHLINYSIYNKGGQTFECFDHTGSYYSFKTESIPLFNAIAVASLCIEFTAVKTGMYKYVIKTSQLSQADDERFMYTSSSTSLTSSLVCDDTSNTDYQLLLDPSIDAANFAEQCPDAFLGIFGYVSNITAEAECNGTGSLNVCDTTTKMSFNYTACSTVQAYSSGGELYCISSTTSGTHTQVTLYNLDSTTDESTNYRIVCYVVESSTDGNVYASQYPQSCSTGQTPTSVSSPGGLVVLTASLPPESSGLTAGASAGIAVGVLLIFLILLLLIGFCIYKKTRKVDPGPIPPDQGVAPAETKMPTEDKSRPDMMRNIRPFNHSNMRRNDDMDIEDIEDRDKVPRLERDLTQHSTLRQQIITPSVVNPMVREWSDMGYSDDLTLIDSENMRDQLDPPSPIPEGLTPVDGYGPVYGYWNTIDERHAPEKKKKKKKKVKKKNKKND
ncbi:uncharacterized protein [Mytilus edulis]|uniref:uncharacterized protein n=1 Tax=Mytilus edulis TaxID=6550 RepID=UPI0039EEAE3C